MSSHFCEEGKRVEQEEDEGFHVQKMNQISAFSNAINCYSKLKEPENL